MDHDLLCRVDALEQRVAERLDALEQRIAAQAARPRFRPKPPTPSPLTVLHWAWREVSPEERLQFLTEMLTPRERRALQYGFKDEADAS